MDTKKLRQKILDLAIHGKLVPQDPNDEPASVLLERIKAEKEQLIKEGKIKRQKKSASSDTSHYGNDVPFEVPEGWVWISGKDLFLPMRSTSPSGEKFSYIDIDAIDNKKNIAFPKLILTESAPSRASRYTQYGDTLFSMVRPYLKNIAKVTTEHCIASTGFYICHPYSNINADFIFYLMTSDYVVDGLNSFIKGDNSPSISSRDIDGWKFPLPPVAEQQRIVNEIKRYFSIISTIENEEVALKDSVKKAKSKVLELALSGKLTSDTSHYPQLPDGWEYKQLEEVAEIFDNVRIPLNANERENRIRNKQSSELYPYYGATGQVGLVDEYLLEGKFLLLGEDGAPFLDKNAIKAYPVEGRFWVNNHAHILKPKYDFDFLMYYLNGLDYKAYASGSTRLKLTQSSMSKIKIPMPPKEEQRQISQILNRIFKKLDSIVVDL